MKNKRILPITIIGVTCLAAPAFSGSKVTSIDFENSNSSSVVKISSDAPITYEKQENSQDKQIIVDLKDTKLSKAASRKLDTSSFSSKVKLVSPYQVKSSPADARVVIQLRDAVNSEVQQDGNTIKIVVPNGSAPETPPNQETAAPGAAGELTPDAGSEPPKANAATNPPTNAPDASSSVSMVSPTTKDTAESIEQFIRTRGTKHYIGKKITIQVRDADILDVLQLIGDASGFNVIVGDDVKGKITLSLLDTPWDQALDLILTTRQLGAERNNNVLRILTLTNLTAEKNAELAAQKAAEAASPKVTRVFPISYARLADLANVFKSFGSVTGDTSQTTVQPDDRTNSIIVRDTQENIDRMKKLIELLDTQTPQVLIEAKVIEASEQFGKSMNGTFGFYDAGANGIMPYYSFFNGASGGNFVNSATGATPPSSTNGSAFGGSFSPMNAFQVLPGVDRINAALTLSENEQKIRVISSPKTVVLNKEAANIVSSQPVGNIQTTTVNGVTTQTPVFQSANLSLNVKPTVTNDGAVLMDVSISRDQPITVAGVGQAVGSRNMSTKVLVDSGSTLVIGGVFINSTEHTEGGIPFLRKIPIIGALFGGSSEASSKSELFIFVTPKILNEREAGLGT